jgi:anti-sigma factor RsiW
VTRCDDTRLDLGAYVLDGLDASSSVEVEAHLDRCADCREEFDDLRRMPDLLDLARVQVPVVPSRVRDRVIAAAARRQARRRLGWVAAAMIVVAGVVGGVIGWNLAPGDEVQVAMPLETVEPFDAAGRAVFAVERGVVTVRLELEGLESLPAPGVYEAWVSTPDRTVVSIGQLDVAVDGSVAVDLSSPLPMDQLRYVWVTAEPDARDPAHAGPTVLRAVVPDIG